MRSLSIRLAVVGPKNRFLCCHSSCFGMWLQIFRRQICFCSQCPSDFRHRATISRSGFCCFFVSLFRFLNILIHRDRRSHLCGFFRVFKGGWLFCCCNFSFSMVTVLMRDWRSRLASWGGGPALFSSYSGVMRWASTWAVAWASDSASACWRMVNLLRMSCTKFSWLVYPWDSMVLVGLYFL